MQVEGRFNSAPLRLIVLEPRPVQYHAPVYRCIQQQFGIAVTAVYGSDESVQGVFDKEFATTFRWDSDLLSGYESTFLCHSNARDARETSLCRELFRELRDPRATAFMLVGYGAGFYRRAIFAVFSHCVPVLFRAETTDVAQARSHVRSGLRDCALKVLYSGCSRLLYIGRNSRKHYQRLGCSEKKLVFSPYCVDTQCFRLDRQSRQQLRWGTRAEVGLQGRVVLLFSGKLSRRKGPDLLLEAISQIPAETRRTLAVLFLGDGELREQLQQMSGAIPDVLVRFVGFQNQTRLSAYYHAADMLVLPSRFGETWGLVLNEALHHGIPCVVSDAVGSAADLICDSRVGRISRAGSASALAEGIVDMLPVIGSPQTQECCKAAVSQYTVERAAEGIARACFDVLQPYSNPSAKGMCGISVR